MHEDNGVKIVEPDGSMLVQRWEQLAELIVNHKDISELVKDLGESTIKQYRLGVDLFTHQPVEDEPKAESLQQLSSEKKIKYPQVFVGRDTRASSPLLAAAVIRGIQCLKVPYVDFGEVTTP